MDPILTVHLLFLAFVGILEIMECKPDCKDPNHNHEKVRVMNEKKRTTKTTP